MDENPGLAGKSSKSERHSRGVDRLRQVDGDAGVQVVAALAKSFPEFAAYVVEYPFGDIYSRPGLGLRERELAVVAALCAMGTAAPQLRVHIHAALHVGCTPAEIVEVVMQMSVYAGFPAALNGLSIVREVFSDTGIRLPLETHPHDSNCARGVPIIENSSPRGR
jgi:4-carboxymuconolactone decarboxylase